MKLIKNPNEEHVQKIKESLEKNDGYCPCILFSKGKPEYKCPCAHCRTELEIGQECHCGLYIRVE